MNIETKVRIVYEDDDYFEIEIVMPNDLQGDTSDWTEEEWKYWNDKMKRLDEEGTRGQLETIKVKLEKNPFIDGTRLTGDNNNTEGA